MKSYSPVDNVSPLLWKYSPVEHEKCVALLHSKDSNLNSCCFFVDDVLSG